MEPTMPAILCERTGHLAHVTLNRAECGNRISMEMFRTLGEKFTALDANPAIRCILLTANGADFSLGVDVPDVPRRRCGRPQKAERLSGE
jgi:enoyl-CoA hydratase/carnithine racemase